MKAVLEILPGNIDAGNCVLICEASNDGFSYVVKNEETNKCVAFAVYHFPNTAAAENNSLLVKGIFVDHTFLSENFKQVYILYSFPESVLVPFDIYDSKKNASILNMIHGDFTENNAMLSDVIVEIKAYNIYRLPSKLKEEIDTQFPSANSMHQYSALIKNVSTASKLSIIFYPNKIILMLQNEGKLLLVNSFVYKTTEDVSYILLNVCNQFEMQNVPVEVGGLIENDSALYKEIYKYFEQVSFSKLPDGINITEAVAAYPSHFLVIFLPLSNAYHYRKIWRAKNSSACKMPHTRPTTDVAKEGLFNIIENNISIVGLKTLDIFGGTGSISYELASRGADHLTIVEKDPEMYAFIQKSITDLKIENCKVIKMDVFRFLESSNEQYDFIFAGPPYALKNIDELPELIKEKKLLTKNGWFVLEHTPANNYEKIPLFKTMRDYGTTVFSIFINN